MDVQEAPEVPTEHPQWDISDDDEDEKDSSGSESEYATDDDDDDEEADTKKDWESRHFFILLPQHLFPARDFRAREHREKKSTLFFCTI